MPGAHPEVTQREGPLFLQLGRSETWRDLQPLLDGYTMLYYLLKFAEFQSMF